MAGRLRGMSTESIASSGGGLPSTAAVLREHKVILGATGAPSPSHPAMLLGSRPSMLLGLAAPYSSPSFAISTPPAVISIASSPVEPCALIQTFAEVDEFEENEIWGIISSWHDDGPVDVRIPHRNTGDAAMLYDDDDDDADDDVDDDDDDDEDEGDHSKRLLHEPGQGPSFLIHGHTVKGCINGSIAHAEGHALAIKETSLQQTHAIQGFSSLGPKSVKPRLLLTDMLANTESAGLPAGGWHAPTTSRTIVYPVQAAESYNSHPWHQSAPVNIPNWSKILKPKPHLTGCDLVRINRDDEDTQEGLPPHELLAREHARSTYSVCEGQGRTLKGWDLSRMRNAVWRKTGFAD